MNQESRRRQGGFAIVMTVAILALLAVVAIGMLSLSTIEVRQASLRQYDIEARANARLALMLALGELQKQVGPDQRVTAPASLLDGTPDSPDAEGMVHPHWTGVWRSTMSDGGPIWLRDDLNGGLRDRRADEGWDREEEVLSYLVSGNEGGYEVRRADLHRPGDAMAEEDQFVQIVGAGSVDPSRLKDDAVSVPLVSVDTRAGQSGSYGYWVSDLGIKANIATKNHYAEKFPNNSDPDDGGYFRVMVSQEVDESMMGLEKVELAEEDKPALLDLRQVDLASSREWVTRLYHDITTYSQGVLSDVRDGGLKKDLTVYLEEGEVGAWKNLPGLVDLDRLVGPRSEEHAQSLAMDWTGSRHRATAPRFGMLRDWANQSLAFNANLAGARTPASQDNPELFTGRRAAVANDNPTALTERVRTDLQPILVEGSAYSTFSYHPNPPGWRKRYNIRSHIWPRVVLWNPYNVAIQVPRSVIMLQLNTRNDFQTTDGIFVWQWVSWGGGTRSRPPRPGESILASENYNDPYTGMSFFSLPEEVIGPGECYVYSTEKAAEYDSQNLLSNTLSSEVAPDPARNYYISSAEFDEDLSGSGFNFIIRQFWFHPFYDPRERKMMNNQADDARMIWKRVEGITTMDVYDFDDLPQMQFVSCSLQYGAGKEPRVAWNESNRMDVERTALFNPILRRPPDVRTREGFRMRWMWEHESNTGVLNNPAGPGIFESALLANWNPRGAYSLRSPWETIGGDRGDGSASGPWFFGAYTRDLYDEEAMGWQAQMPFLSDGKFRGNPFGLPQEGRLRNVLFDVARNETGVLSLAQFQHAKLSEFVWHPSYPVANSLVDPRLGKEGMDRTAPVYSDANEERLGGWTPRAIGWAADQERSSDRDEWARFGRGLFQNQPLSENLVHDLSFDLNHSLWDEFFLGSGDRQQRRELVKSGAALPNGRIVLRPGATHAEVWDYHRAASALYVNGAFNVNSTSVEAWKAVLASTRPVGGVSEGGTVFPRVLNAPGGEWRSGDSASQGDAWSGSRTLGEEEITRLAEEIVWQVKRRGPFLSMSDFVNRRLSKDETGRMGPLQAAIEAAGLNADFAQEYPLDNGADLRDYRHPDNIAEPIRMSQELKPSSKAWGAPGYLTQADVLQVLGPMLSARSDSFLIRAYGDAKDGNGEVQARAWCEVVVQRTPRPVDPDASGLNPKRDTLQGSWGRAFEIKYFRWLSPGEV